MLKPKGGEADTEREREGGSEIKNWLPPSPSSNTNLLMDFSQLVRAYVRWRRVTDLSSFTSSCCWFLQLRWRDSRNFLYCLCIRKFIHFAKMKFNCLSPAKKMIIHCVHWLLPPIPSQHYIVECTIYYYLICNYNTSNEIECDLNGRKMSEI